MVLFLRGFTVTYNSIQIAMSYMNNKRHAYLDSYFLTIFTHFNVIC